MGLAAGVLLVGAAMVGMVLIGSKLLGGATNAQAAVDANAAAQGTAPSGSKTGKVSWFSGGTTASGVSTDVPGIAVCTSTAESACQGSPFYGLDSLGGYWLVTLENGKQFVAKQTDIGPANWTNRIVDFTQSLMSKIGNPATDSKAALLYLGKSVPAQYQHLLL